MNFSVARLDQYGSSEYNFKNYYEIMIIMNDVPVYIFMTRLSIGDVTMMMHDLYQCQMYKEFGQSEWDRIFIGRNGNNVEISKVNSGTTIESFGLPLNDTIEMLYELYNYMIDYQ